MEYASGEKKGGDNGERERRERIRTGRERWGERMREGEREWGEREKVPEWGERWSESGKKKGLRVGRVRV